MTSEPVSDEQPDSIPIDQLRKSFSGRVIDHLLNPRNFGELPIADGVGRASISCGDAMQISLRAKNNRILDARFVSDGCGPVIACGSMITELVKGKTVSEAMTLTENDLIAALDGLPEPETHCATLAIGALRQALADYLAMQREPWKRMYRHIEPFTSSR